MVVFGYFGHQKHFHIQTVSLEIQESEMWLPVHVATTEPPIGTMP